MAGRDPAIHETRQGVDPRDKPGDDDIWAELERWSLG
jgi:hypothetical protein